MAFLDDLLEVYNAFGSDGNTTEARPACHHKIDHQKFHLFLLIPSSCMIALLAFTITRTNKALDWWHGRPGAVFPMNILGKSHRSSYAAAWGSIAFLMAEMTVDKQFAFTLHGPPIVTACNAVLSMFIYGVDYFPVFASLALESVTGFVVGTMYAWMLFAINVTQETDCHIKYSDRAFLLLRDLPKVLCLAYLSISLPVRIFQAVRSKTANFFVSSERVSVLTARKDIDETSEGRYVRSLFKPILPPPSPPTEISAKIIIALKDLTAKWIYNKNSDFRYSARMVSIVVIGTMLVYKFTVELSIGILSAADMSLKYLRDSGTDTIDKEAIEIFIYVIKAIQYSFIAAMCFTCSIGVFGILNTVTTYRNNLLDLYKGRSETIPPRASRTGSDLLIGAAKYAGFQVAYIAWGLVVHFVVFFILALLIAVIITLIRMGLTEWLIWLLHLAWPVALMTFIFWLVQFCAAKLFLQEEVFALDNRRGLFTFTFFMFFYNVFLGLLSCLMRIIKSIGIGLIFLPRLDNSALPKRFEMFDPGFAAYVGFIHLECVHTHPVLVVFLRLLSVEVGLTQADKKTIDTASVEVMLKPDSISEADKYALKRRVAPRVSSRARTRWFLLYTLYNNPTLRYERKQHITYAKILRERIEKILNSKREKTEIGALVKGINNSLIPLTMPSDRSAASKQMPASSEQVTQGPAQMNWVAMLAASRFLRVTRGNAANGVTGATRDIEMALLGMTDAMTDDEEEL